MRKEKQVILIIILGLMISASINFADTKDDRLWTLVGVNEKFHSIKQVLNEYEDKESPVYIKLKDSVLLEENIKINKTVYIQGKSDSHTKILANHHSDQTFERVIKVEEKGRLFLENVIIEGGGVHEHPRAGAGIYNDGYLKLTNCIVQNNTATYGVGIFSVGRLEVYDSIIRNNHSVPRPDDEESVGQGCAGSGGGVKVQRGRFIVKNSIFSNNYATRTGGGLKVSCLASGEISQTLFLSNAAELYGGALSINGDCIIENCAIALNHSQQGGGIHLTGKLGMTQIISVLNESRDLELMQSNSNFNPKIIENDNNVILQAIPNQYEIFKSRENMR